MKYGSESDSSNTGDLAKFLALKAKTPSNLGTALEMQALRFRSEEVVVVRPSVNTVRVDKTDWDSIVR